MGQKTQEATKTGAGVRPEVFSNDSPAMNVREAARFLRCGRNQVFALIAERKLPVARIGRGFLVPRWACESLLEAQWSASGRPLTLAKYGKA